MCAINTLCWQWPRERKRDPLTLVQDYFMMFLKKNSCELVCLPKFRANRLIWKSMQSDNKKQNKKSGCLHQSNVDLDTWLPCKVVTLEGISLSLVLLSDSPCVNQPLGLLHLQCWSCKTGGSEPFHWSKYAVGLLLPPTDEVIYLTARKVELLVHLVMIRLPKRVSTISKHPVSAWILLIEIDHAFTVLVLVRDYLPPLDLDSGECEFWLFSPWNSHWLAIVSIHTFCTTPFSLRLSPFGPSFISFKTGFSENMDRSLLCLQSAILPS